MIETIKFLFIAYRAYADARKSGRVVYIASVSHGVPQVCLFVGVGREAWRVTQLAIEGFK